MDIILLKVTDANMSFYGCSRLIAMQGVTRYLGQGSAGFMDIIATL